MARRNLICWFIYTYLETANFDNIDQDHQVDHITVLKVLSVEVPSEYIDIILNAHRHHDLRRGHV